MTSKSPEAGSIAATALSAVSKTQTVNVAIRARCTDQPAPASHLTRNPTAMQPIPATR